MLRTLLSYAIVIAVSVSVVELGVEVIGVGKPLANFAGGICIGAGLMHLSMNRSAGGEGRD